jgi:hypothetical protein
MATSHAGTRSVGSSRISLHRSPKRPVHRVTGSRLDVNTICHAVTPSGSSGTSKKVDVSVSIYSLDVQQDGYPDYNDENFPPT